MLCRNAVLTLFIFLISETQGGAPTHVHGPELGVRSADLFKLSPRCGVWAPWGVKLGGNGSLAGQSGSGVGRALQEERKQVWRFGAAFWE